MSGKFTPGPWQLGCEMGPWTTDSEQGSHCSWSIGKGRNVIAIAVTHADYDDPEFLANARLIASAPALLEALELWLAYDQDADPGSVDFMLAYDRALTATKAAIAAAKGKST